MGGFWSTVGSIINVVTDGKAGAVYDSMSEASEKTREYREKIQNGDMDSFELKDIYRYGSPGEQLAAKRILKEEGYMDEEGNML